MSYIDLRDFAAEHTETVPELFAGDPELTVAIEKSGGGTPGKTYCGTWRYVVTLAGTEIFKGQGVETGMPHTHAEAARVVAEFLADRLDPEEIEVDLASRLRLWASDDI